MLVSESRREMRYYALFAATLVLRGSVSVLSDGPLLSAHNRAARLQATVLLLHFPPLYLGLDQAFSQLAEQFLNKQPRGRYTYA